MNLRLFQIADQYLSALETLTPEQFDEQTIADTLEGLKGDLTVKAQNVAAYCLNLEAESHAIESVAASLAGKAKAVQNRSESLKSYLKAQMLRTGITEIKANDGSFSVKIRNNPASVEILEPGQIACEYHRIIPEKWEPDKVALKKALQEGKEVAGARLVQTTRLELK